MDYRQEALELLAGATLKGSKFFSSALKALSFGTGCRWVGLGVLNGDGTRIDIITLIEDGEEMSGFSYDLAGSPCATVYGPQRGDNHFFVPRRLFALYPKHEILRKIGAVAYRGELFLDSEDRPLGHVFALHDRELDDKPDSRAFFRLASQRIGAEFNRWQTEQRLKQGEALLQDAVASISDGFALYDKDDRLILHNSTCVDTFEDMGQAFPPGTGFEEGLRRVVDRGHVVDALEDPEGWIQKRLENHRQHKPTEMRISGRPDRWFLVTEYPTREGGTVIVRTDITERKRMEEEQARQSGWLQKIVRTRTAQLEKEVNDRRRAESTLRQLNGELEQRVKQRTTDLFRAKERAELANRTKTEFLNNMSHELRTPLNAIIGFAEMTKDEIVGPVGTSIYRDYAGHILSAGSFLMEIIDDILDVSRIEAGRIELEMSEESLTELVESTVLLIRSRYQEKEINIDQRIDKAIPPLLVDERRFKQILVNLLSNAVKFTAKNGTIVIGAERCTDGRVAVSVADNGIGIPEKKLANVFKPFEKIEDSMTRTCEGIGLGLSIAKGLSELHGGELLLESTVGEGTKVTLLLPVPASVPIKASV